MTPFATFKPIIPTNDFIPLILESQGKYYIQIYDKKDSIFLFKEIELNHDPKDYIKLISSSVYPEPSEKIFAHINEKEEVIVGTKKEVMNQMIVRMRDKSILPMAKLKIAEELEFFGEYDKYRSECEEYFRENEINFNSKDYFNPIFDKSESDEITINNSLQNSLELIKRNNLISWTDIALIDDTNEFIRIVDSNMDLKTLFEIIHGHKEFFKLKILITKKNPKKSFDTENNYSSEPLIKSITPQKEQAIQDMISEITELGKV